MARRRWLSLAIACSTALGVLTGAGSAAAEPRIHNGFDASTKDYPWMVYLEVSFPLGDGSTAVEGCGGTLVKANKVLTAAHCFFKTETTDEQIPLENLKAVIGRDNVGDTSHDFLTASSVWLHPGYDNAADPPHDDIAVLTLKDKVEDVEPLPLAIPRDRQLYAANKMATVLGWGMVDNSKPFSNSWSQLQGAHISLASEEDCTRQWRLSDVAGKKVVCAGGVERDGADACRGDSGGPLFTDGKLIGVVSYGEACQNSRRPAIYTKVSSYYYGVLPHLI